MESEFAKRLKAAREKAGYSQVQLAEAAGIPLGTLTQLEQGRRLDPRLSTLKAICNVLEISVTELVGF